MIARPCRAKVRYSTFLTRVRFKNGVLQINGRRGLVLGFVATFAVGLIGVLWNGLPALLTVGAVVGLLILGWAFVDMWRAVAVLHYDTHADALRIERRSRSNYFQYQGTGSSTLKIRVRSVPGGKVKQRYSVVLVFEDTVAEVPFQLHNDAISIDRAMTIADRWAERLGLSGPPMEPSRLLED